MKREALAAQLAAAERELRDAQAAVTRKEPGARERYARAMTVLEALNAAVEAELLLGGGGDASA